jgi:spore coat protein CotF
LVLIAITKAVREAHNLFELLYKKKYETKYNLDTTKTPTRPGGH